MACGRFKQVLFRQVFLAFFLYFLFSCLVIAFFKIQILEKDKWQRLADNQHQVAIYEPFKRGIFYSDSSIEKHPVSPSPFVMEVLTFNVMLDPMLVPKAKKDHMASQIDGLLCLDASVKPHFHKQKRYRKLGSAIPHETKERIAAWWSVYAKENHIPKNALYFVKEYKRKYPFGKMLGQVLGGIRDQKCDVTNQAIPTSGLELAFDELLKGREGKKIHFRSPRFEFEADEEVSTPVDGCEVYLTINHCVQAICEEELKKGVEKVNGKRGWAVVMDPFTGEIVSMAHYPFFDPAAYKDYYNDKNLVEETRVRALTDCFEPGSTMKPITLALALLANDELKERGEPPLFSPREMMRVDNNMFEGRKTPLRDVRPHKFLDMQMSLQKSSNVYPARLAEKICNRLGPTWYREKLTQVFGFGQKCGVELPENIGLVPTPGKAYASGVLEWSAPTPYSLAIGYNLMVNSVQLARAFSIFANGGYLVKPTLLKKIVRGNKVLYEKKNTARPGERHRVVNEDVAREIVHAMKFTTKPGGSGQYADIPGYTEAGKTSTTEKLIGGSYSKSTHFSTFMGICPTTNPRFVIFIGVDEPERVYIPGFGTTHYGGKCAAPIFANIAKRSLNILGIKPDDPFGFQRADPRFNPEKADWIKEAKELNEKYENWNH